MLKTIVLMLIVVLLTSCSVVADIEPTFECSIKLKFANIEIVKLREQLGYCQANLNDCDEALQTVEDRLNQCTESSSYDTDDPKIPSSELLGSIMIRVISADLSKGELIQAYSLCLALREMEEN
jgi:hypothetical protein